MRFEEILNKKWLKPLLHKRKQLWLYHCLGSAAGAVAGMADTGRGGLGRGAVVVWIWAMALSISPASSKGHALRLWAMLSSMARCWSAGAFFSTQLATSLLCPGWPMPMRSRQ